MKHTWIAYAVTGVLAAGAGVAIAGRPTSTDVADVTVTEAPATTTSTTIAATTTTSTTVAATTTTSTTVAATTTTSTTVAPTTTTSTTVAPTTTAARRPTTLPETTTTAVPILDRAELSVGVANATNRAGLAGDTAAILATIGYTNVATLDASPLALSTVFYDEGLEAEAGRLAVDAGLGPNAIGPMSDAPAVTPDQQFQLLLVVGRNLL